jgi:hypothetical protein
MRSSTLLPLMVPLLALAIAGAPPPTSLSIEIRYYDTDDQKVIAHIDAIQDRHYAQLDTFAASSPLPPDLMEQVERLNRDTAERIEGALAAVPHSVVECIVEPPAYAKVKVTQQRLERNEIINVTSADSSGVWLSKGHALPPEQDPRLWTLGDTTYREYGILYLEGLGGIGNEGANALSIELLRVTPSNKTPGAKQCSVRSR